MICSVIEIIKINCFGFMEVGIQVEYNRSKDKLRKYYINRSTVCIETNLI